MSNKSFIVAILAAIVFFGGIIFIKNSSKPPEILVGQMHANQGQEHVREGSKHAAYNSSPATSGPHRADEQAPANWGVFRTELSPEIYVHNEEHGGVLVTYNPKMLSEGEIKQLEALFLPPYSNKNFTPTKAIVMPRAEDQHAIELAAWTYTYSTDKLDMRQIMKFYLQRVGKSPEGTAGPFNAPSLQTN